MNNMVKQCVAILIGLALTATGLWAAGAEEEPAAAADKKYVTDPTNGKVVTAPEYGGTLTFVYQYEPPNADMSIAGYGASKAVSGVIEKLGHANWAIDRSVNDLGNEFLLEEHYAGALAESWEQPDPSTVIFHIREGVRWHDKPPMNGRELVAEDIVFNFHRYSGTGSGFTEPPAQAARLAGMQFESITATDEYTVVFKLREPPLDALVVLLDDIYAFMNAPEVIKQHGDVTDWRNLVGTGPFMMTDWVESSSITFAKNPDYWGYDEKYPENRLPYVDQLVGLYMPEVATFASAVRTGKVDYNGLNVGALVRTVDAADSLRQTNPELRLSPFYFRANETYTLAVDKPPFDDVNVRKAMQMAVDLETINNTYYTGLANTTPQGMIASFQTGYTVPFDEWPEEVKKGYTYDPEGAEKLLDEAGYPRGADGIRFETRLNLMGSDVTYAEIVTAYLREIGVEVKAEVFEWPEFYRRFIDDSHGGEAEGFHAFISATPYPPLAALGFSYTRGLPNQYHNRGGISDPHYDALVDAARAAASVEELKRISREADMYLISQHWHLISPVPPHFNVTQPWVIGFDGDSHMGLGNSNATLARLWIDDELKGEMGY